MHPCPVCDESLDNKHSYNVHLRIHPNYKPHKCDFCEETFRRKHHLQRHVEREHPSSSSSEDDEGSEDEVEVMQKKFPCPRCKNSYRQLRSLQRHIREKHGDGKKIKCEIYNVAFARKDNLRRHNDEQHSQKRITKERGRGKIRCPKCPGKFSRKEHWERHYREQHGSSPPRPNVSKPFTCELCGKGFGLRFGLNMHLRTHREQESSFDEANDRDVLQDFEEMDDEVQ